MGDNEAGVRLETVPSATRPHAHNAPSSRPKGDGEKRKALPYAQLLSEVHNARHPIIRGRRLVRIPAPRTNA
jgi:hypothetical protein